MVHNMVQCSACPAVCSYQTSRPYSLGPIRGRLCAACEQSLGLVLGRWLAQRSTELRIARDRAEQALQASRIVDAQTAALETELVPHGKRAREVA